MITNSVFAAADLVIAELGPPRNGNPAWLNVILGGQTRLAPVVSVALGGSGLYAIFLDGLLVYIGVFVGPALNLRGGSVLRTRWVRHVGTMTMRGQRVSLRANVRSLLAGVGSQPLAALAAAFANPAAALHTPQGMEMAARKVRFAASNWATFSGPIGKTLDRIQFGYLRLGPEDVAGFAKKALLSGRLGAVEKTLVERFRPPLNTAHNPCPLPVTAGVEEVLTAMTEELAKALAGTATAPVSVEETDPADHVLDELPANTLTLADELAAVVGRTAGLILYYTHGGNEIRLGPDTGTRRHERPYLVLRVKKRGGSFRAYSTLPVDEACTLGFKASERHDGTMECTFPVAPGEGVADRLLELCKRAARRA